jgi:hypothetical protein
MDYQDYQVKIEALVSVDKYIELILWSTNRFIKIERINWFKSRDSWNFKKTC